MLTGTPACLLRDQLSKARFEKRITPKKITTRLIKIGLPNWLQKDIIAMVRYNQSNRSTCPIEQAMFDAVCALILKELMQQDSRTNPK